MVRSVRLLALALAVLLFATVSVSAQSTPWRVVQASDGTLYLLKDGSKSVVVPAAIDDDELATIPTGPTILGDLPLQAPSPSAPSPAAAAPQNADPQAITVQKILFAPLGADKKYITVAALVQNPNLGLWMPTESYTATAYDSSGTVIGSNDNVLSLGAGETRWVVVHQMTAPGQVARVDFQIRRTKAMLPAATDPAPQISVVQSSFQPDRFFSKQLGQVHNDGSVEVPQVRVDVVYFDAQGGLLGTAFTFVSHLGPGETVSFSASGQGQIGQATDIKTFASAELLR